MKNITKDSRLIITDITNKDLQLKVIAVLNEHGVKTPTIRNSYLYEGTLAFRIYRLEQTYGTTQYYKISAICANHQYTYISAEDFLNQYQVRLEHKGFKGSYEKDSDYSWYGRIQNCGNDIIAYSSSSLVGLQEEFIDAVDNYINSLALIEIEKNKIKDKNMNGKTKRSLNANTVRDGRGWYVYDKSSAEYMNNKYEFLPYVKDDSFWWQDEVSALTDISKYEEANEEVNAIFSAEAIEEWRKVKMNSSISDVVSYFMTNDKTFTRHDVIKGLRELYGPDVEISYDLYRATIIELIEEQLEIYNYVRSNDGTKFVYKYVEEDEEEVVDTPRKKDAGKHTIPASQIRHMGMKPGDTCYFKVFEGGFVFNNDEDECFDEMEQDLPDFDILYETSYVVDKNWNIRLRKNIFEIAGIPEDFQQEITYEDMGE